MRFMLLDGHIVQGRGYADIVQAMATEKFTQPRSIERYRKATAKRIKSLYGHDVDPSTDKSLVLGMIQADLLVRLPQ